MDTSGTAATEPQRRRPAPRDRRPTRRERARGPRPGVGDRRRRGDATARTARAASRTPTTPRRGRALDFIEDFIRDEVLPLYANTHTESSGTGLQTTRLREDARAHHPRRAVGGDDEHARDLLRLRLHRRDRQAGRHPEPAHPGRPGRPLPPAARDPGRASARSCSSAPSSTTRTSCPWRESIADVVEIHEDARRAHRPRAARARAATLRRPAAARSAPSRPLATSRASSATPRAISALLHRHGALSFWDFAAAAPYVEIEMDAAVRRPAARYKDAIFLSPHKFIGGPGHARRAGRPARAADATACRRCPAAAPSPTSTRSSTST